MDDRTSLCLVNEKTGPLRLELVQQLPTTGATAAESFTIGIDVFLALAFWRVYPE